MLQKVQWLPYRTCISLSPLYWFIQFILILRQNWFWIIVYKLERGSADTSQITVKYCPLIITYHKVPALQTEHQVFIFQSKVSNANRSRVAQYIMIPKFISQYFYNSIFHTVSQTINTSITLNSCGNSLQIYCKIQNLLYPNQKVSFNLGIQRSR